MTILTKFFANKPMMIEANFTPIMPKFYETPGVIPIHGILTRWANFFGDFIGTVSYDEIYEAVNSALENPKIEQIVLDIDSPGGEVSGLFDLCDFIASARKTKQIIAHANDNCLSAAYAIASNCSKVLVNRTSAIGSIGVIATHLNVSEADKKEGLKYTTIFKGARKNDLNPHEPIENEAFTGLDEECARLYEMFVELVSKSRDISTDAVKTTEAGIFYGLDAVKIGLADEIVSSFKMENFMKTEEEFTENPIEKPAEKQIVFVENPNAELTKYRSATSDCKVDYKAEIAEIAKLCKLAKMPEKLTEFVESGVSVDEARDALMKALAGRSDIIRSTISTNENPADSPVVAVAKARAAQI
jgi:signal peptide peptidase SppA